MRNSALITKSASASEIAGERLRIALLYLEKLDAFAGDVRRAEKVTDDLSAELHSLMIHALSDWIESWCGGMSA